MAASPARTAVELLRRAGGHVTIFRFDGNEDDVATIFSASFCAIGTDSAALPLEDGTVYGLTHPRAFGTFHESSTASCASAVRFHSRKRSTA